MTLVELLVAMVLLAIVMTTFFLAFEAFVGSSTDTIHLSIAQGTARNTMRILEADLRSANPLLLVPASFTEDPNGVSSSGASATSPTDVVAMAEDDDLYSPCPSGASPGPVNLPAPYLAQPVGANVVWAYDPGPGPNADTLTRYSYCPADTPIWVAGPVLRDVVQPSATMFTVSQATATPSAQVTSPSTTVVANQASPVCGSSVDVQVTVTARGQRTALRLAVTIPLPNQAAMRTTACQ